ncbi:hypothetical protein BC831DRAFT_458853 [Entophlyctis helioformis]|nr:hypothetical protein BC831DRAFT_458853 [Entophlyctis helioformis]
MAQSYADFSSTDTGSKWSLAPAKPKSTAQPSSLIRAASPPGTAHRKGFVQPWFLCGLAMMRIGDAAIAGVALNMLAVMACQSILSYCLNAAAITALPPPSFEWRLSQQYYALGGACTSIICVICWQIIVDLKRLLVADHRHPGMTHSSFSVAVETSHGTMTTHLPHVAGGGGGRTMTIDGNEA